MNEIDPANFSKFKFFINLSDILFTLTFSNNFIKELSTVKYLEVDAKDFVSYLNNSSCNLLEYNKNTLYIIKEGNYIDIKNIFTKINYFDTNIDKGDYHVI